jgi:hypothetical protein
VGRASSLEQFCRFTDIRAKRLYLSKLKKQLAQEAGIKWKHNALRHSFASYRLAQIQNANWLLIIGSSLLRAT